MEDLTNLIISNNLQCFSIKYSKNIFYEKTKLMQKFNSKNIKFNSVEFQALFYFVTQLNVYITHIKPNLLKQEIRMFFDRCIR